VKAAGGARRGWSLVAGVVTLAAFSAILVWVRPHSSAKSGGSPAGDRAVSERTTVRVGSRATVVAEAGSAFAWNVGYGDAARVQQVTGDLFYRVDEGGPFVVSTVAGDITALGTCFRVEVRAMAIAVHVYEGRVRLANAHGRVELAAGEQGSAAADAAPARLADEAK
jgi:ferric-dicitrate binding protein FerR (iron transport regulator)